MPLGTEKAPSAASPLWIIALFIALSEVTAGAASAATNGVTRLIFACFAVAFPTAVLTLFVWLLVKHAPKLYAPGQYSREITPEVYRRGISRAEASVLSQAVAETVVLGKTKPGPKDEESNESDLDSEIDRFARIFKDAYEKSFVEVEVDPPGNYDDPIRVPVTNETQMGEFLDEVWFNLQGAVEPYSYNKSWVLTDMATGKIYRDAGRDWARRHGFPQDERPVSQLGISVGGKLKAIIMSDRESE